MGLYLVGDQSPVVFLRAQFYGQFCLIYLSKIWMQELNEPLINLLMIPLLGSARIGLIFTRSQEGTQPRWLTQNGHVLSCLVLRGGAGWGRK